VGLPLRVAYKVLEVLSPVLEFWPPRLGIVPLLLTVLNAPLSAPPLMVFKDFKFSKCNPEDDCDNPFFYPLGVFFNIR